MSEISATEASKRFSDLLDAVEQRGETFTVVRRGGVDRHDRAGRSHDARRAMRIPTANPTDPDWERDLEAPTPIRPAPRR